MTEGVEPPSRMCAGKDPRRPVLCFDAIARGGLALAGAAATSGCSRSPSLDILGSFFPSWLLCLVMGVLLAIAVRLSIGWAGFNDDVPFPLPTYLALAVAAACLIWLVWFGH